MSKKESVSRGEEMEVVFQNCSGQIISLPFPPLPSLSKSDEQWANHGCLQKDGQQLTFFLILHLFLS